MRPQFPPNKGPFLQQKQRHSWVAVRPAKAAGSLSSQAKQEKQYSDINITATVSTSPLRFDGAHRSAGNDGVLGSQVHVACTILSRQAPFPIFLDSHKLFWVRIPTLPPRSHDQCLSLLTQTHLRTPSLGLCVSRGSAVACSASKSRQASSRTRSSTALRGSPCSRTGPRTSRSCRTGCRRCVPLFDTRHITCPVALVLTGSGVRSARTRPPRSCGATLWLCHGGYAGPDAADDDAAADAVVHAAAAVAACADAGYGRRRGAAGRSRRRSDGRSGRRRHCDAAE